MNVKYRIQVKVWVLGNRDYNSSLFLRKSSFEEQCNHIWMALWNYTLMDIENIVETQECKNQLKGVKTWHCTFQSFIFLPEPVSLSLSLSFSLLSSFYYPRSMEHLPLLDFTNTLSKNKWRKPLCSWLKPS